MSPFYLYRLVGLLVPRLPARTAYGLFASLGNLLYHLSPSARAIVRANMSHALGPQATAAQIEQATRAVFRHSAQNYCDLFRLPALDTRELEARVQVDGWEHIEDALARGRGLILVTAHFGAPELIAQVVAGRGVPVTTVVERLQPEPLFRYTCALRESHGMRVLPVDGALTGLFRALRRNEVIALLADRDITESGIIVDFFGEPTRMAVGHVQMALRTGAALIVGYCRRRHDGTFYASAGAPVQFDQTRDRDRAVRLGVQQVVAQVESFIAAHPEQWVMFQPVWNVGGQHHG